MTYLPYAGIGSRETPEAILRLMWLIGATLAANGFTLRSGGAPGADTAFEEGVKDGPKEIYIPWSNFNGKKFRDGALIPFQNEYAEEAMKIAEAFHPNWKACSQGAKNLHTRNVAQVLGPDLQKPSKFIVCWTKNASGQGGTGQALRIAKAHNIPIFDLGREPERVAQELATFCEYLVYPEIADPR